MGTEPADIFADAFKIFVGGFGSSLHFFLSDPDQEATPGGLLPSNRVATIRLTPELLKGLTFLLYRQVVMYESANPRIELQPDAMARVFAGSGIDREKWDRFWGYT